MMTTSDHKSLLMSGCGVGQHKGNVSVYTTITTVEELMLKSNSKLNIFCSNAAKFNVSHHVLHAFSYFVSKIMDFLEYHFAMCPCIVSV